jgi:hypothetical protein
MIIVLFLFSSLANPKKTFLLLTEEHPPVSKRNGSLVITFMRTLAISLLLSLLACLV